MCRPRFCLSCLTTRSRVWLPSDSSQNSWFCKLLPKQVTTPVLGVVGRYALPALRASILCLPGPSARRTNEIRTSLEEAAQW